MDKDTEKKNKLFLVQWVFEAQADSSEDAVRQTVEDVFSSSAEIHMVIINLDTYVSKSIGVKLRDYKGGKNGHV